MELNDEIKSVIPKVIALIFEELKKHGVVGLEMPEISA